jgi:hypothetical protein
LRILGVAITDDYVDAVKHSIGDSGAQKKETAGWRTAAETERRKDAEWIFERREPKTVSRSV